MLTTVERYEQSNLKNLIGSITKESFSKIEENLNDPAGRADIQDKFFQSALAGLRKGVMEYENDPLLPILQDEISKRTAQYANLTASEEQKLLMLNDSQKKAIVDQDKQAKTTYLAQSPSLSNAGVKAHEKFQSYVNSISAAH